MDQTSPADVSPAEIAPALKNAGVAGAGGAGFPSYVKWQNLEGMDCLLVNHQESEPSFYADKWLAKEHAERFGEFLESLLGTVFESIVIGTKARYRDEWIRELEAATNATVFEPSELPLSVEQGTISIAYTPNVYTYSEEKVLLMVTTGTQIGDDLPTDHGWIVHNTESIYNIARAVIDQTPVTRKYVHVDGNVPEHRCLEVPIGTPATELLAAAGVNGELEEEYILADGGPGWCYAIEQPPSEFGVRKRTNGLLVLEREVAEERVEPDGQIDVLDTSEWEQGIHETSPTELVPDRVRIPLITNAAYAGFVTPSTPLVEEADTVSTSDVIARPTSDGISNTQHASVDGTVTGVTDTHIIIERS